MTAPTSGVGTKRTWLRRQTMSATALHSGLNSDMAALPLCAMNGSRNRLINLCGGPRIGLVWCYISMLLQLSRAGAHPNGEARTSGAWVSN
jgi:hypothetical protein